MRRNKIPTIFGLLILVAGLVAGLFLIKNRQIFQPGASPTSSPQNVKISNITNTSFTVSWTTNQELLGFVKWGTDSSLGTTAEAPSLNPSFTHSITVKSLSGSTIYLFKINSDGVDYDNSGKPWQVKTASNFQNKQPALVSGKILDSSGNPASDAIVYLAVAGGSLLSTTTSSSGTWVTSIANIPTEDLTSFVSITPDTPLTISVDAGPRGESVVQSLVSTSNPTPDITLGKNSDFTGVQNNGSTENPNASIELPAGASPESKFNVSSGGANQPVTIDSVGSGETISTVKPEFFGKGPTGTTLNIILESQVITAKVKVDSKGQWKWDAPSDLANGIHTLTISWTDKNGTLQKLVKTFTVAASESPAFQASASASLAPSPTETPSPTGLASILPSPTLTESPSPTETASASSDLAEASLIPSPASSPLPATGALTPTLALFIMGIGTIVFGIVLWKRSAI